MLHCLRHVVMVHEQLAIAAIVVLFVLIQHIVVQVETEI